MNSHLKIDLGTMPIDGALALFAKHVDGELKGLVGTYAKDSLFCSKNE